MSRHEAAYIREFYLACTSNEARESCLAQLPFFYDDSPSVAFEEFVTAHLATLDEWMTSHRHKPFMYRAILCIEQITAFASDMMQHTNTMHTAATTTA